MYETPHVFLTIPDPQPGSATRQRSAAAKRRTRGFPDGFFGQKTHHQPKIRLIKCQRWLILVDIGWIVRILWFDFRWICGNLFDLKTNTQIKWFNKEKVGNQYKLSQLQHWISGSRRIGIFPSSDVRPFDDFPNLWWGPKGSRHDVPSQMQSWGHTPAFKVCFGWLTIRAPNKTCCSRFFCRNSSRSSATHPHCMVPKMWSYRLEKNHGFWEDRSVPWKIRTKFGHFNGTGTITLWLFNVAIENPNSE